MKRVSPNWWSRVKSGRKAGIGIAAGFLTICGFVIGGISAAGKTVPLWIIISCCILCPLIGLFASYCRGRLKLLPDAFVDEFSSEGEYTAEYTTPQQLREACDLTKPLYRHEYVPFDVAEQWRIKNPKGFVSILDSDRRLCAVFGLFSLKSSFMEQFIKGKISDTQLSADDILTYEDTKNATQLYLSGVVVRDPSTYIGSKRARVMFWCILHYLRSFDLHQKRTLFALAVSEETERLMHSLQFQLASDGKYRQDKCNLYERDITTRTWEILQHRIGDLSSMCTTNI